MISRVFRAIKRRTGLLSDYSLVAIRNPRLLLEAVSYVMNRRARGAESVIRAGGRMKLEAGQQSPPVSPEELLQQLSHSTGVIILGETFDSHSIGVADTDILLVLDFLLQNSSASQITIDNKNVSYATTDLRRLISKAAKVFVTFGSTKHRRHRFEIEIYFRKKAGEWISNNGSNHLLRALRDDRLLEPGLTTATEILGAPTLADRIDAMPVDAVYTWVDHTDPNWVALRSQYEDSAGSLTDANALSRFHNNDELRYSLRSVSKNAPWVRRIFILTNCARPDWLRENDERLVWVNHSGVIPPESLPTFNSHVIESCLHKIPDLSEHFLYLNDDVFLARRLPKKLFFDINGNTKSFLETYGMVSGTLIEGAPDYLNAARNVAALVRDEMGFAPTQLHQHTVFALRKSVLQEMEDRWQDHFEELRKNRFRTAYDLNITSFFYHHYALGTGRGQIGSIRNMFIKSQDIRWQSKLREADSGKYDTLCINEGGASDPSPDWHYTVRSFLESRYPDKAKWEL